MKKLLCLALLAAATCAFPTRASAWDYGPYKVHGGIKIYCTIQTPSSMLPLAPWYLYYPAEARYLPVGPAGYYPNWRQPAPPNEPINPPIPVPSAPPPAPAAMRPLAPPQFIQQAGYSALSYPGGQAPSYWYGR